MNRPWIFILLAFALVIYFWVPTMLMFFEVKHGPEPHQIVRTTKPVVPRRPLGDYSKITERNLFGAPEEKDSVPSEEIEANLLAGIPVAKKDLGLNLVGTVLADDPKINIAIIDNRSTQLQESYHEGDRIGEVLVKRILRHHVVIETKRGEEVLVMSFEGSAGGSSSGGGGSPNPSSSSSEDSSSSSFTDLEPTVSSGPFYGGYASDVGAAARGGGNAAAGSSGSALGGGTTARHSGGSLHSSSPTYEYSSSSSSQGGESESSLTDPEPTVSSGPIW
jgi:hypothetical protein